MFLWIVRKLLCFAFVCLFSFQVQAAVDWKVILPGLQQATWTGKDSHNHDVKLELFKLDLKNFKIKIVQAKDYKKNSISAKEMVQKTGGLLAINGGFFDHSFKSLGLLVQDAKELNPLRPVSWWGIFSYDKSLTPRLDSYSGFKLPPNTEMAIQAGPRLVDEAQLIPLKSNDSQKTFIAVSADRQVILGLTHLCSVDAAELAKILKKEVNVLEALNLDGGSSTQLYAKIGAFEKDLPSISSVANGLVVLPRR